MAPLANERGNSPTIDIHGYFGGSRAAADDADGDMDPGCPERPSPSESVDIPFITDPLRSSRAPWAAFTWSASIAESSSADFAPPLRDAAVT